ncbi:MAG: hypothetical protein J6L96_00015 [Clostridia bacterium]|nr:hypothetical protein [Clostridia bacterium]
MSALKNFGITFLISSIVFGIVAYFVTGLFTSTVDGILDDPNELLGQLLTEAVEVTTEEIKEPDDDLLEIEGDSYTVLITVTDRNDNLYEYYPKTEEELKAIPTDDKKSQGLLSKEYKNVKTKAIILMQVSKETGEYRFIPIPSVMEIHFPMIRKHGDYVPVEDIMYMYDEEFYVNKIEAITGISPDYTVLVNITEFDDIFKETGDITCHIKDDIYTDGKTYFTMTKDEFKEYEEEQKAKEEAKKEEDEKKDDKDKNDKNDDKVKDEEPEEEIIIEKVVSAGNVTVGAKNIEAIFMYENYENGFTERSDLLVELLKSFLSKLSSMDDATLARVYGNLYNKGYITTDISNEQFLSKVELLRAYNDYEAVTYHYQANQKKLLDLDIQNAVKQLLGLRLPPDPSKGTTTETVN